MQITVKVKPQAKKKPAALVRDCVKSAQTKAEVEEVFPGVETGNRARLVTVRLPNSASPQDCEALLTKLRADEDIEYAEPAVPRKAR